MNFVIVGQSSTTPSGTPPSPQARVEAASHARVSTPSMAPTPRPALSNRRWSPRTGLDRPGYIGSNTMTGTVNCVVRNTSKHGALLEIVAGTLSADQLPECFTLVFLVNRIRSEVNCVVRWRRRNEVGVNFVGAIRTSVGRRG